MNPILKQRLVGATVLSALAVIFVPMMFDDSESSLDPRDFDIPGVPMQIEQSRFEPPEDLRDIERPPPVPVSSPVENSSTQEYAGKDKKARLTAWVIQVGSFSKTENADQLRDQLRQAGFPAYVETGTKNGALLYRVRVGPELDPERARNQRDQIARKFNVKGIVLPSS